MGRIIIGRACDKIGSKAMLALCMIVQALLLFSLIRAESLWAFYMIAMLFGFTYEGAVPAIIMINSEFFGISSSEYIYDVTGGYSVAFLIGGMVLTVGFVLSFIIKLPKKTYLR